jgi:hypothetical protein
MDVLKQKFNYFFSLRNHFDDEMFPLNIPIMSLKFKGWFVTKKSSWIYIFYGVITHLFFVDLSLVSQLAYLFCIQNFTEFIKILSAIPSFAFVFVEDVAFLYFRKDFFELIADIHECLHEYGSSDKFHQQLMTVNKITKGIGFYTLYIVSASCVITAMFHDLVCVMWIPIEIDYWTMYTYQSLGFVFISITNAITVMLPSILMCYCIGFTENVCRKIKNLETHKILNPHDTKAELIKCTSYQLKIYSFARRIEQIYSPFFIIRFMFTSVIICTSISLSVSNPNIKGLGAVIFHGVGSLFIIFIPCYYGSKLTEASAKISDCLFHSEWMLENKEYRQLMKIAIGFCSRPITIRAGTIFNVNLETFMWICEKSYSFYAVLTNLNH